MTPADMIQTSLDVLILYFQTKTDKSIKSQKNPLILGKIGD